ncbi:flagellinolysin [Cytobacillus suaedae]|nr:flagellinolysin [Cytobacillus suaedae]
MRINHNIAALNTYRQLSTANSGMSKSMEKLSSGLRINRAGDDAAGLAISEKMRGQIRGLEQASRNSQDGISMLQTAEGAAGVIQDMLQRGRELSVQAANGTLTDSDRLSINEELEQLKSQISTVANDTEFNTIKMLNSASISSSNETMISDIKAKLTDWIDDSLTTINNNLGLSPSFTGKTMNVEFFESSVGAAASMGTGDGGNTLTLRLNLTAINSVRNTSDDGWGQVDALVAHEIVHALQFTEIDQTLSGGIPIWFTEGVATAVQGGVPFLNTYSPMSGANITTSWNGDYGSAYGAVMALHESTTGGIQAILTELQGGATLDQALDNTIQSDVGEISGTLDFTNTADFVSWFNNSAGANNYLDTSSDFDNPIGTIAPTQGQIRTGVVSPEGIVTNNTVNDNGNIFNLVYQNSGSGASGKTINVQVGANENQSIEFDTVNITASGLGISGVSVLTSKDADEAISVFDEALQQVSGVRGKFGALQNRLEHTINNLNNTSENLTGSESRIRDVDMASEMMNQTKNSILSQAAQAMLAQANQQPQGVLQLLR